MTTIMPPLTPSDYFSSENYAWIESFIPYSTEEFTPISDDQDLVGLCAELASHTLAGDPDEFAQCILNYEALVQRYRTVPDFARLLKMGLEYGVAAGSGSCAFYLGASYYLGGFVEQDYESAKELYEMAEDKGNIQAMVNLGYIYEYGRVGEPDYEKAFKQYAKAAALGPNPEALYKMGDMYSRGRFVDQDKTVAYYLYERSLEVAGDHLVLAAQPAIRIADLICEAMESEGDELPYNPMRALELYQLAERGLRIDIALGQVYYRNRLQDALDGQVRARKLIDEGLDDGLLGGFGDLSDLVPPEDATGAAGSEEPSGESREESKRAGEPHGQDAGE